MSIDTAAIPQQDIFLDFALPLQSIREATRLDLVNPYSAEVSHATLVLCLVVLNHTIAHIQEKS